MTEKSEWQFLVDYLKDDTTDFYNDACQNQLVALWTSYCLHNSLDVDTAMYYAVLMDLHKACRKRHRRVYLRQDTLLLWQVVAGQGRHRRRNCW